MARRTYARQYRRRGRRTYKKRRTARRLNFGKRRNGRRVYRRRGRRSSRGSASFQRKIMVATSALNTYAVNDATRMSSTVGFQQYTVLTPLANPSHLSKINDLIGGASKKYYLENAQQDLYMKNQESIEQYVTVYKWVARNDIADTETDIQNIYATGWAEIGNGGGGNQIGVTPFQNNKFCAFMKIIGSKRRVLKAGETMKMSMFFKGKYINQSRSNPDNIIACGRTTRGFLIISHGAPINSDVNRGQVTPGAGAIDVITANRYQYREMADNRNTLSIDNNYPEIGDPSIMSWAQGKQSTPNVA